MTDRREKRSDSSRLSLDYAERKPHGKQVTDQLQPYIIIDHQSPTINHLHRGEQPLPVLLELLLNL